MSHLPCGLPNNPWISAAQARTVAAGPQILIRRRNDRGGTMGRRVPAICHAFK